MIMDSETSLSSLESMAATRMISRRRPLHTCGVSILAIVHKACTKAQDFKGPIGSMTKRIAKLVKSTSPFIYAMQFQWLAVLSFADDQILAIENMVETVFPPSTHVFNRVDKLVLIAETLPGKFDNAINKFPLIIRKVPFLDWALVLVISWLNFFISILTYWGSDSTREKEITIDTSCNECHNESKSVEDVKCENMEKFSPISDTPQAETKTGEAEAEAGVMKCTYKEMLEKGTKENLEKKEDSDKEEIQKSDVGKEETGEGGGKNANQSNERINKDDPILDLFESGWHMNPGR